MKKFFVVTILSVLSVAVFAQDEPKEMVKTFIQPKFLGTFQPKEVDADLVPSLERIRNNNKGEKQEELKTYKEYWSKIKHAQQSSTDFGSNKVASGTIDPIKVSGFNALTGSGTPPDNTIAIGKNGQIIAAVNSSLRVYDKNGNGNGTVKNFGSFFSTVTPTADICDPLVHYDPVADRFIVFAQTCDGDPATSSLLIAVSTTNSASTTYNFYQIDGNLKFWSSSYPQNTWFDYPKLAISQNDIFISGNLFNANYNFVESALFQIDKNKCYAGQQLGTSDAAVFNAFTGNPFTLVPVNYGRDGHYGNKMYVVTSRAGNSFISLFEVNGNVQSSTLTGPTYCSVPAIADPADGVQKGTSVDLKTGDARGMSAILVNGVIHYVFHSGGPGGYVGINYNRIWKNNNIWQADNKLITFPNIDAGFPAIASAGHTDQDQSVIIGFNYSSLTHYPGIRAVMVDNGWNVSNAIELFSGVNYVDFLVDTDNTTRWGDYSGIARDHTATTPTVWSFGMAGSSSRRWTNHVSEIAVQTWSVDVEDATKTKKEITLYPNPVVDFWNLEVNTNEAGLLKATLLDLSGRVVENLMDQQVVVGKHKFSFNKGALANGTYFVQIKLNDKILKNEKITVSK